MTALECIDASGAPELRVGEVYTVREFVRYFDAEPGVLLNEVEPPAGWYCFKVERFRPARNAAAMATLRQICASHTPLHELAE